MPDYDLDLPKLCDCIRHSLQGLEYPRARREQMIRALAGPDWSEETSQDLSRPVNLIDLYTKVLLPNLISQGPRVLLSTFDAEAKPAVAVMEQWLNAEIERMNFADTMQRVALDALFNIGIVKVGLATPADAASLSWQLQAGQPYVEPVSFDDFVFDLHARRLSEASFVGHRIRKPLRAIQKSKLYSAQRLKLQPSIDAAFNAPGDQRANVLGRGFRGTYIEDYDPMVDLWEIWLPRENIIVTIVCADNGDPEPGEDGKPLRVAQWLGPYCGPFHYLGYGLIPDNPLPKGPIQSVFKLDETVNHIYRKLIRQAQDQKGIVGGADDGDLKRIVETSDQQVIKLSDPKSIAQIAFNGPNQENALFGDHLKQLFTYMVGNMDSFGGLSPQSKTASQDKLLAENSSRLVNDMQARTVAFAASVLKSMAWYQWEHPSNRQTYEHPYKGMRRGFTRTLYPRDTMNALGQPELLRRQVPFEQLDLRVDPYSTLPQTPAGRLAAMNGVVTQIVIPMMQLLQQQGVAFDMNRYLEKVGKYLDSPDLAEILTIQEPVPTGAGPPHDRTMAPQTERSYTRENIPMRSERGASQQYQAQMSGTDVGGASTTAGAA